MLPDSLGTLDYIYDPSYADSEYDRTMSLALGYELQFWNPSRPWYEEESRRFYFPKLLSGSDYGSSGSVEVSNHRVFLEQFADTDGVHDVYGGDGTFGVAIREDALTPEMVEVFEGLDDYPVIDDEDWSDVEHEAENEAWESWASADFRRSLRDVFPDDEHEDLIFGLSPDRLYVIFTEAMEESNTYWINETGNNATIDLDRIAAVVTLEQLKGE